MRKGLPWAGEAPAQRASQDVDQRGAYASWKAPAPCGHLRCEACAILHDVEYPARGAGHKRTALARFGISHTEKYISIFLSPF